MSVFEFERDTAIAVLFEHALDIVHVHPFHAACEAKEPLLLDIFGESCDVEGGSRSQEPLINRHQSHLRQPDLAQCEVPSDFFGDMRHDGIFLIYCCLQTKVEFNAQKELLPKVCFHIYILCVVIIC